MERQGFLVREGNGHHWWQPVKYDEDGRVTASLKTWGSSALKWKQYPSEQLARAAALRLIKKLANTESDKDFNSTIERWHSR